MKESRDGYRTLVLLARALLCGCLLTGLPAVNAAELPDASYQRAIAASRAGDYAQALTILRQLHQRFPRNARYLHDLAAVELWAGNAGRALALAGQVDTERAPRYVVAAIAKAARDEKRYPLAIRVYGQILARWPGDVDGRIGLALTLADAGQVDKARALAKGVTRQAPQNREAWYALAYVNERAGDHVRAAAVYRELLARWPRDDRALTGLLGQLLDAGAVQAARDLASRYPGKVPKPMSQRLLGDLAAQAIRWGELPPASEAQRFAGTDRALVRLDDVCQCDWGQLDLSQWRNQRLLFDRMVALRDRVRMDDVLQHLRQATAAKVTLPAYAQIAAGDAWLYRREPERAEDAYRSAIAANPRNYNARLSLFYALVELERFDEALTTIDALVKEQPPWRRTTDRRRYRENPRRFTAELAATQGRAFADDLAGALQRLQGLLAYGPENTDLQLARATDWRWRGWEERAQQAFARLLDFEPTLLGAEIGLAETHLDLRQYRAAERSVGSLVTRYPENLHVQRLARRQAIHNDWYLHLETGHGRSSGGTFGSSDWLGQAWLYTPPMAHDWRLFFHNRYDRAQFVEGLGQNHRHALGLEYRHRRWQVTSELSGGSKVNKRLGANTRVSYRASDHWRAEGSAEINSMEMPLRGQNAGIRGHLLGGSLVYRWHESQRASGGLSYMHMTDGNDRVAFSSAFRRRLLNRPHWKIEGDLGAYASRNTRRNVIYFNPRRDLALDASVENLWIARRRYEQVWAHRLTLGSGSYWQRGFGTGRTWLWRYQQEFTLSQAFAMTVGLQRARRVYDGDPEYQTRYFATLEAHF